MHAGEIFLIIFFNCLIFAGFYYAYIRMMERRLRQLKSEIQELEDLVAAIIEEFEEVAVSNEVTASNEVAASNEKEPLPVPETAGSGDFEGILSAAVEKEPLTATFTQSDPIPEINLIPESAGWTTRSQNGQTPAKTIQATDPRHQRIVELWKNGIPIEEIARQLGTGRGEVQLVLGIYQKI